MQTGRVTWLIAAFLIFAATPGLSQSNEPVGECTGTCAYQKNKAAEDAAIWEKHQKNKAADYRKICNESHDREYADLCQQWRMAEFAKRQVKWVRNQFWATVVEGILLLVTVIFTGIAAIAATKAANAANASVEVASKNAERQLRAYVYVDEISISEDDKTTTGKCRVSVSIKNSGQTPAHATITAGKALIIEGHPIDLPAPLADIDFDKFQKIPSSTVLGSGDVKSVHFSVESTHIDRARKKEVTFYFHGAIHYTDVFDRVRKTKFCAQYMGVINGRETFKAYGKYTSAD